MDNQVHSLRLTPGQDLKRELVAFCETKNIRAACILSAVGSLRQANLRLANSSQALTLTQKFEIVSATGTLSTSGCHIHISIADSDGKVSGGHLLEENVIYTTCEVVILELGGYQFKREMDSQTTFKELKIYFTKS